MTRERDWNPDTDDAELARLHGRGIRPILIAEVMGFSVSTIHKHLNLLGLVRPRPCLPRQTEALPKHKPNPITFAQFWLGGRLTERLMPDGSTSHFLDGSPTNLDAFMLEANRVARKNGGDMLIAIPKWEPR